MKHNFLHLSDLHFRGDWPEQSDLVLEALFADIKIQRAHFPDAYVIFSGDLVQAGGAAGQYDAFAAKVSEGLSAVGFPRERRISIPGNHDVSRAALLPKLLLQQGSLSLMKDEELFNNHLSQLTEQFFSTTFTPYRTAEATFAKYTCCHEQLGGSGWDLDDSIGVYCLNSALCSSGGLNDLQGKPIVDKGFLQIDTRAIYRWLAESTTARKVLIMHHPLDWLTDWSSEELSLIIAKYFHVVVSGHVHRPTSSYSFNGVSGVVHAVAPALFTRKSETLGYSYLTISEGGVDISYRAWTAADHRFVAGTAFSGNDSGVKHFPNATGLLSPPTVTQANVDPLNTISILEEELDEALTSYSAAKRTWVERDLAPSPETAGTKSQVFTTSTVLCNNFKSCIVRAPRQFGLTCLGRFIALQHAKTKGSRNAIAVLDLREVKNHKDAVAKHIRRRCQALQVDSSELHGIILDNWQNSKQCQLIYSELRQLYPALPVMILQGMEDPLEVARVEQIPEIANMESLFLWSLSRVRIRDLTSEYVKDIPTMDGDAVTKKVIEELDSLNLHRTPLQCLTLLKLLEQAFDDSPVNRTDMIGRVLHLLFFQFQAIPRYSTRPDLKDCEHALGYLCEWLMTTGKSSFSKVEFIGKVNEYCASHLVDIDTEVLFVFLAAEHLIVRREEKFEFRFNYWIYYFAAHRMHHSATFANFILSENRYAAFPEIIEFYAGIDRKREDAVTRLTADLRQMNKEFQERTQVAPDFDPWQYAEWVPSEGVVQTLLKQVTDGAADSTLPVAVKDAIADQNYDHAKPYKQELAKYMAESSLRQMLSTMRGAARALRNSDYVGPALKTALMNEVVTCWRHVCQILAVLSPLLADEGTAYFEGMNFWLDDSWKGKKITFEKVLSVIPFNIAWWYQSDIFSKKMGKFFATFIATRRGSLEEALILMVMIAQRSTGWEREVEAFIDRSPKNSFYLSQIFSLLFGEFRTAIIPEMTRQQLRRLAAKSLAKHSGAKNPNSKVIEARAKDLDRAAEKEKEKDKENNRRLQ
jgi:Calcineurin-like phosphoesterase